MSGKCRPRDVARSADLRGLGSQQVFGLEDLLGQWENNQCQILKAIGPSFLTNALSGFGG